MCCDGLIWTHLPVRAAPKLDPFKPAIDEMLRVDPDAPRKQRHTATRIHHRLLDEHHADVSYGSVRDYVRARRVQIEIEAGRRRAQAFVPQLHAPGAEAEADFGEVWVILAEVKTKCHMFTFRLFHSGRAVHRISSTQSQKRSWRAISSRSKSLAASRGCRSSTTTSPPP